jgi:hypothetical protein
MKLYFKWSALSKQIDEVVSYVSFFRLECSKLIKLRRK